MMVSAITQAQVAVGTSTAAINASAQLEVSSNTKGFLPPRMTQAQRNAIANPAQGLIVYCTNCGPVGEAQVFNGIAWTNICGSPALGTVASNIVIGLQTWTTKNLDVASYSDGTEIPQVTDPTEWSNLTTGAWCYYNNDPANGAIYGKLYNWYAVVGIWNEASKTNESLRKKLAPSGFHIPSSTEISILIESIGGQWGTAYKMKEIGNEHWIYQAPRPWEDPIPESTNSTGFTALPGGYRFSGDTFGSIGIWGLWWSSSTHFDDPNAGDMMHITSGDTMNSFTDKFQGLSVRCIKD